MALAVRATIGRRRKPGRAPDLLHRLVAVHLRHHHVHQDDGDTGRVLEQLDRLEAGAGGEHLHAAALEHAAEREDVADVVVDHQHLPPDQVIIGSVQALEQCLLLGRQVGDHAVEEERRLVQQPLGRLDSLHHDAPGEGMQARVLLGGEFLAGEDHHRQVTQSSRRRGCAPAPRSRTCRAGGGRARRSRMPRRAGRRAPRDRSRPSRSRRRRDPAAR